MEDLVRSFTAPQSEKQKIGIGSLAMAYFSGVLRRLSKKVVSDPEAAALFRDAILPNADKLPHSSACWLPEAGSALRCMSSDKVRDAAVHALLGMHSLGCVGHWSVSLETPMRASFAGHVFTLHGAIEVAADPSEITIVSRSAGQALRFAATSEGWRLSAGDLIDSFQYGPPSFVDLEGFRDKYVQGWREPTDPGLVDLIVDWPPPPADRDVAEMLPGAAQAVAEALALLDGLDAEYARWMAPMFRGVAASPTAAPDMMQSGSYTWHPGVFSSGFPIGREALGELMLHEVSHQHFLLLNATVPLVDRSHNQTYFSSLKGLDRRLDRIVLGYHATANMSLYWSDLVDRYGMTPRREYSLKKMYNHTKDLAQELRNASQGLTEAGHLFVETHADILAQHGLNLDDRARTSA
jgi:HEXXH motif-containing protein